MLQSEGNDDLLVAQNHEKESLYSVVVLNKIAFWLLPKANYLEVEQ